MTRASLVFAVLLCVLLPLSLLAGRVWIDPFDVAGSGANAALIVMELRAPRAVLAVVVGAGLGAAGAAMQGYLRNPLADPGLFGIAPMAALGAVASFWFGALLPPMLAGWSLPAFALIGAGLAMILLAMIAGRTASDAGRGAGGGIALFTLAGLMIASFAGALTALAITMAPNAFALSQIVMWLNGALTDRSWSDVWIAAPLTVVGIGFLIAAARSLDALTLGEDAARSMGMDPRRLLFVLVVGVGLTVGAGVAVAGIIGFVGLIVPHLVRPLTNRMPSSLIVPSAIAGAVLVLAADSAVRILPFVTELRLGIALSLIGAPFFLWLLIRMRRGLV
ncbi:iron chelate uptake ABC transporter family permease subunit [Erythrobacter sp. Alg231-14]|uniref:iron chelate uptake ABC transporter family permease subunit n=1 Tax=Erythrobacter sp. Alg231-14 TaxID=1922225 RepID=UPI000D560FBB